ncbi:unnamed protein product [Fusarium langsethiae]|nr:unnamed protein product [Fusarium langsethiae]GKU21673.1 unnamed protein product [Fusarium langsethiae]
MDSQTPQRHTIYVNSSALGPPCCQSLGISLVSEVRSHGQTKMVLIECRTQLAHAQATTAALETRNNQLAAENLRLTLALGHLAPWAQVRVPQGVEGHTRNREGSKEVSRDGTNTLKDVEEQGDPCLESEYESEN